MNKGNTLVYFKCYLLFQLYLREVGDCKLEKAILPYIRNIEKVFNLVV